jgi:hypothetical protein
VQIGCAVVLDGGLPGIGSARASNRPFPVGSTLSVTLNVGGLVLVAGDFVSVGHRLRAVCE